MSHYNKNSDFVELMIKRAIQMLAKFIRITEHKKSVKIEMYLKDKWITSFEMPKNLFDKYVKLFLEPLNNSNEELSYIVNVENKNIKVEVLENCSTHLLLFIHLPS